MTPSKRCTAAGQALRRLFSSYLLTSPSSLSVDCWRSNQHVDVKKNYHPQRRPTLHPPTMTQTAATATATSRSATHLRPPPQQTLDFMRTRLRARLGRWTVECTLIAYSTDFIMTLKLKLEFHRFSFGDLIRFMIHKFSRPLEFLAAYFSRIEI